MKEFTGTTGKWKLLEIGANKVSHVIQSEKEGTIIATVQTNEADAKLLRASKELYNALNTSMAFLEEYYEEISEEPTLAIHAESLEFAINKAKDALEAALPINETTE